MTSEIERTGTAIADRLLAQLVVETGGNRALLFTVLDDFLAKVIVHHSEPHQRQTVVSMIAAHLTVLVPAYAKQLAKETRQ